MHCKILYKIISKPLFPINADINIYDHCFHRNFSYFSTWFHLGRFLNNSYLWKFNFLYQVYDIVHSFSINITKVKEMCSYFFLVLNTNEYWVTSGCYIFLKSFLLGEGVKPNFLNDTLSTPWQIKRLLPQIMVKFFIDVWGWKQEDGS